MAAAALGALLLAPAPAPAAGEVGSEIRDYVAEQLDANLVPGAALAVVDGHRVGVATFGTTGRDDEPVEPDTPFLIGSVTKSFTAVAVMQLVERGEVDLDAPAADYLPWFSVQPPGSADWVTVRSLLNQTSGIPVDAGSGGLRYLDDEPIDDVARELIDVELDGPPGAEHEYANGNYVLLGALVQEVSGLPFGEYLQRRILDPLQMGRTFTALAPARAAGMSEGHRYWFGLTAPHVTYTDGLLPAGGLISTAPDIARYAQMLLNGGSLDGARVLSRRSVAELESADAEATVGPWAKDPDVAYGMGLFVGGAPFGPEHAVFHPGGSPDFAALLALLPDQDRGLVLLMNATPEVQMPGAAGAVDRIGAGATSLLMGAEPAEGTSMRTYYLFFDVIVVLLVAALVWVLVRALRHPPASPRTRLRRALRIARATMALVAGALLLLFPLLTGLGWKVALLSVPDVAVTAILIGVLLLAVGLVRGWQITRRSDAHAAPR